MCISWLYVLIVQSEKLAEQQNKLAHLTMALDAGLMDIGISLSDLMTTHGKKHNINSGDEAIRLNALVDEAETAASGNPTMLEGMEKTRALLAHQSKLLDMLHKMKDQGGSTLAQLSLFMQYQGEFEELSHEMFEIRVYKDKAARDLGETMAKQAAARDRIKVQVLIGIVTEVALTVLVVLLFLKNISTRMTVLVKNAELIPKEVPLTVTVSGGDELAYLDQTLHKASEQLRQASAYRRSLMDMVSHDLRSPLTAVRLLAHEILLQSKDAASEITDMLQELQKKCDLVVAFVEDLLTVDRMEAGKLDLNLDLLDIKEAVAESADQLAPLVKSRNIRVVNEVASANVLADKFRIVQVLNNLISNAVKFSPPGTSVELKSQTDANTVKIMVVDHGPGIPEDRQNSLFDKYFQVNQDESTKGFGLGLAICKLIITEHKGSIGVISAVGQGTTFWFSLPLDKDEEVA